MNYYLYNFLYFKKNKISFVVFATVLLFAFCPSASVSVPLSEINLEVFSNKRVGIYVGSFDPLHKGHENLINKCLNKSDCDYVIVFPIGSSAVKTQLTAAKLRREMVESLYKENERVITTQKSAKEFQDYIKPYFHKIHFIGIIGSDSIQTFFMNKSGNTFNEYLSGKKIPDYMTDNAAAACMIVPSNEVIINMRFKQQLETKGGKLGNKKVICTFVQDGELEKLSSTEIRQHIKQGKNIMDIKKYLDLKVFQFIVEHGLYRGLRLQPLILP